MEASGVVDEVGSSVSNVSVGDAVFGHGDNAVAQYAVLTHWAHKPDDVSFEVAGGLPVVCETALRALDEVGVKSGEDASGERSRRWDWFGRSPICPPARHYCDRHGERAKPRLFGAGWALPRRLTVPASRNA